MSKDTYDLAEHRHRFAVWAAARASQRGFASVRELRRALEGTDLREELFTPTVLDATATIYDELHDGWCSSVERALQGLNNASYGRAAKLVSVYVKTSIVLGTLSQSRLAFHAHPPIDRVLLRALASSPEMESTLRDSVRGIAWSRLKRAEYKALIRALRRAVPYGQPFWALERYWEP